MGPTATGAVQVDRVPPGMGARRRTRRSGDRRHRRGPRGCVLRGGLRPRRHPRPADEVMSDTWYDTIATLGWLAAQTERVQLVSHAYVLPYRHPLQVAKSFVTLDALSGGRAVLGAGAGHLESSSHCSGWTTTAGVERSRKPPAGDPRRLRRGVPDRRRSRRRGRCRVAPVRCVGGPPIWIGGSSPAAMRRAAVLADGWLPQDLPGGDEGRHRPHPRSPRPGLPAAFDMGVNVEPIHIGDRDSDVPEWTLITRQSGSPRVCRGTADWTPTSGSCASSVDRRRRWPSRSSASASRSGRS